MTYGYERLAAIYDSDNPFGPDHDYYRAFINDAEAQAVIELGCGTGILTVTLTAAWTPWFQDWRGTRNT